MYFVHVPKKRMNLKGVVNDMYYIVISKPYEAVIRSWVY